MLVGKFKRRSSVGLEAGQSDSRANESSENDSEFNRAMQQLSEDISRESGEKKKVEAKRSISYSAFKGESKQGRQGHTFSFGTKHHESKTLQKHGDLSTRHEVLQPD